MVENSDTKIRKWFESEVAKYAAITLFVAPIVAFQFRIAMDIALIKQNHEAHIEAILTELKNHELQSDADRQAIKDLQKENQLQNESLILILNKLNIPERK